MPVLQGLLGDCPAGVDMARYKSEVAVPHLPAAAAAASATTRSAGCRAGAGWPGPRPGWLNRVLRIEAAGHGGAQRRRDRPAARGPALAPRCLPPLAARAQPTAAHRAAARPRTPGDPVVLWADTFTDALDPGCRRPRLPRC